MEIVNEIGKASPATWRKGISKIDLNNPLKYTKKIRQNRQRFRKFGGTYDVRCKVRLVNYLPVSVTLTWHFLYVNDLRQWNITTRIAPFFTSKAHELWTVTSEKPKFSPLFDQDRRLIPKQRLVIERCPKDTYMITITSVLRYCCRWSFKVRRHVMSALSLN